MNSTFSIKKIISSLLLVGIGVISSFGSVAFAQRPLSTQTSGVPKCSCAVVHSPSILVSTDNGTLDAEQDMVVVTFNQPVVQTASGNIPGFTLWINGIEIGTNSWTPAVNAGEMNTTVTLKPLATMDIQKTDKVEIQYIPSTANRIRAEYGNTSLVLGEIPRTEVINGTAKDTICPSLVPLIVENPGDAVVGYFTERMQPSGNTQGLSSLTFQPFRVNGVSRNHMAIVSGTNWAASLVPYSQFGPRDVVTVGISADASTWFGDLAGNKVCPTSGEVALAYAESLPKTVGGTQSSPAVTEDREPPIVLSFDTVQPAGTYRPGQEMTFLMNLSENVTPTSFAWVRAVGKDTNVRWIQLVRNPAKPNQLRGTYFFTPKYLSAKDAVSSLKIRDVLMAQVTDLAGNKSNLSTFATTALQGANIPKSISILEK